MRGCGGRHHALHGLAKVEMTHMDAHIVPAGSEAAPGVARLDAKAINRKEDRSLYAGRQKVYPKLAHGRFRATKWLVMAVTLGIYYALPWLRWHRGPDLPDQAVLLDMANNRFFFFFLEVWPRRSSLRLRHRPASAGGAVVVPHHLGGGPCLVRLHLPADRVDRSDGRGGALLAGRSQRAHRAGQAPWGPVKLFRKGMTHSTWLAIGLATGGAFVFYFRDAPTLAGELLTATAPAIAYLLLGIFTLTTYVLGGIARELCIYMCPWPRIQGAMVDHDTLLVSYKPYRGEPRGAHKKGQPWEGRGGAASIAAPASPSAPPASTSATAPSSSAFSARCASTRATGSWSAGPAARPDRLRHHCQPGGGREGHICTLAAHPAAHVALPRPNITSASSC